MEIIFYIIFSLVLLSLCGFVAYNTYKNIPKNTISFQEGINLTQLPIVTFYCGKKKLNLLLDSGATACVIDSRVLKKLNVEDFTLTDYQEQVWGMEGKPVDCDIVNMCITYSNLKFSEDFIVNDLSEAFDKIKEESGVKLHGIIGNIFFSKHKYVLDFDKMIFYNKK